MSTCNRLHLPTLESQPVIMPKNLPGHWPTSLPSPSLPLHTIMLNPTACLPATRELHRQTAIAAHVCIACSKASV